MHKSILLSTVVMSGLFVTGCTPELLSNFRQTAPPEAPQYTLEEVAQHTTADDCWMAIEGKVYDLTPYIANEEHPAGKALLKGCGIDATYMYNNEPPHSEDARQDLQQFEIGEFIAPDQE